MAFARAFSSKISMARARTRKGGFGKAPCLLKMCYLGVAEGRPSPPRVLSPRGSKGPVAAQTALLCVALELVPERKVHGVKDVPHPR